MKQELKLYTGGTVTKDVEQLLKKIESVCEKVEKAQDSYKSIIEDVYLLHYNKVHKESEMSFYDFMYEKTGMSKSTCASLVAIQKMVENMVKVLIDNDYEEGEATLRAWVKDLSMRTLLTLQHYASNVDQLVITAVNAYNTQNGNSFAECLDEAYDTYVIWANDNMNKRIADKKDQVEDMPHIDEGDTDTEKSGVTHITYQICNEDEYDEMVDAIGEAFKKMGHIQVVLSY